MAVVVVFTVRVLIYPRSRMSNPCSSNNSPPPVLPPRHAETNHGQASVSAYGDGRAQPPAIPPPMSARVAGTTEATEAQTTADGTCDGASHRARIPEPAYGRIRRRPALGGRINQYGPAA